MVGESIRKDKEMDFVPEVPIYNPHFFMGLILYDLLVKQSVTDFTVSTASFLLERGTEYKFLHMVVNGNLELAEEVADEALRCLLEELKGWKVVSDVSNPFPVN